jgi:hypothetical protein
MVKVGVRALLPLMVPLPVVLVLPLLIPVAEEPEEPEEPVGPTTDPEEVEELRAGRVAVGVPNEKSVGQFSRVGERRGRVAYLTNQRYQDTLGQGPPNLRRPAWFRPPCRPAIHM